MKGLLIKDIRTIMQQKSTLLLMWLVGVFMLFTYDSYAFSITYIMVVTGTLTMTTISYDDFNKGMTFLMTLPITRSMYIKSKYLFMVGNLILNAVAIIILSMVAISVRKMPVEFNEVLLTTIMSICCLGLFLAVILPFLFKYGAEKGRVVLFIMVGAVTAVAFAISKVMPEANLEGLLSKMDQIPVPVITVIAVGIVAVLLLVSMSISTSIIKKKEY